MISLKNIGTGEIEAMIMANELDLQNSLSNARQLIQDQVSEFIPSSFRFVYKNATLSLVQEPKIKLSMITKISSDEYLVAFTIKKDDVRKVSSTLAEETSQNKNNTCSNQFDSDLMLSLPISSPTWATTTESSKMVSELEKSSDYLCVSPCVSPTEPTKMHATHTNSFFCYFEESTPEKNIVSIDQIQRNAFDVIGKRTSDQTTNYPKKSKKRTSHMLGNYFFNLHNKKQNTQQLVLSESSDKKKPHNAAETKGIKIYTEKQINGCSGLTKKYGKFWNAKAEAICKNKKYNGWSKTSIEGVVNCSGS